MIREEQIKQFSFLEPLYTAGFLAVLNTEIRISGLKIHPIKSRKDVKKIDYKFNFRLQVEFG